MYVIFSIIEVCNKCCAFHINAQCDAPTHQTNIRTVTKSSLFFPYPAQMKVLVGSEIRVLYTSCWVLFFTVLLCAALNWKRCAHFMKRVFCSKLLTGAAKSVIGHALSMSVKQLDIAVQMKWLILERSMLSYAFVLTASSAVLSLVNILEIYYLQMKDWSLVITLQLIGQPLIHKIVDRVNRGTYLKMSLKLLSNIMRTYPVAAHQRGHITVEAYMETIQGSLYPILVYPQSILSSFTHFFANLWILVYITLHLEYNICHVVCVAVHMLVLYSYVLKKVKRVSKNWDLFIEEDNRVTCIRHCLNDMTEAMEVDIGLRSRWADARRIQWNKMNLEDASSSLATSIFTFSFVLSMYFSVELASMVPLSKALSYFFQWNFGPDPGDGETGSSAESLTFPFMCAAVPRFQALLDITYKMFVTRHYTRDMSSEFPRIYELVMTRGNVPLVSRPVVYPLTLEFPYRVQLTNSVLSITSLHSKGKEVCSPNQFCIALGDRVLIQGGSGCGKSTLLQDVFKLHIPLKDSVIHDGYVQWVGEGVAARIDFTYLSFSRLFNLDYEVLTGPNVDKSAIVYGVPRGITDAQLELVKLFSLESLYMRSLSSSKQIGKDASDGKSIETSQSTAGKQGSNKEELFLVNASAGEKNRLHAMSCMWRAKQDPRVSTVVWDEGEQGLSSHMFLTLLRGVEIYLKGKTLICISHCGKAATALAWDAIAAINCNEQEQSPSVKMCADESDTAC